MKKYILFPLFAVAVMCFSSCHSQKGRMDDLKDFVEKIQEEGTYSGAYPFTLDVCFQIFRSISVQPYMEL